MVEGIGLDLTTFNASRLTLNSFPETKHKALPILIAIKEFNQILISNKRTKIVMRYCKFYSVASAFKTR